MTNLQKVIKYCAMALAVFLTVSIIGGILGAVGAVSLLFGGDGVTEAMKVYDISGEVQELEIDIAAADFQITAGDAFKVESNIKNLTVENKNGVLKITEDDRLWKIGEEEARLVLCIPDGTVFSKAEIVTGAGRVTAAVLSCEQLKLELGAGEFIVDSLTAIKSADIDGGAGRLQINDGELNNLELDMGVGALKLQSAIKGEANLSMGVGKAELALTGSEEEYKFKVDKGIGRITVNGNELSGTYGSGENVIDIDGGVGEIEIKFN